MELAARGVLVSVQGVITETLLPLQRSNLCTSHIVGDTYFMPCRIVHRKIRVAVCALLHSCAGSDATSCEAHVRKKQDTGNGGKSRD